MKKNLTIGILGLITLCSMIFAYDRNAEADHQRDMAEFYKLEAQTQRVIAEQSQQIAEEERKRAIENEQAARMQAEFARLEAERARAVLAAAQGKKINCYAF